MNAFLNQIAFLSLIFFAVATHAQQSSSGSSAELSCRAQAKEVAAQTYSTCLSETRSAQIDQIRKEYQQQLADLKAKYDLELKKLSGKNSQEPLKNAKSKTKANKKTAKKSAPPKATKGIAKTLPTREEVKSTSPVLQELQETPVVVSVPSEAAPSPETDGDLSIELLPATEIPEISSAPDEGTEKWPL